MKSFKFPALFQFLAASALTWIALEIIPQLSPFLESQELNNLAAIVVILSSGIVTALLRRAQELKEASGYSELIEKDEAGVRSARTVATMPHDGSKVAMRRAVWG